MLRLKIKLNEASDSTSVKKNVTERDRENGLKGLIRILANEFL